MSTWFQICLKEKKLKQLHTLIGTHKFCSAIHIICRIVILFVFLLCIQNVSTNYFSLVQSLSCAWLFATPWTAAHQASLSITNSWGLLKLMSIELVMSSGHLILCLPFSSCLQSFPASESFPVSQFFVSGSQSVRVSASASVLPMNT